MSPGAGTGPGDAKAGVEVLGFTTLGEWESWLEEHHGSAREAWLRIARRNSAVPGLTIEDALDGALCFGWIDGQRKSNDADSFLQRYSPRRSTSAWSRINVEKFETLAAAGRVRPAGYAQRDAARADGRWDAAYESQRTAETPPDPAAALAENPGAAAAFAAMSRSDRYAVILPLLKARTPQRRAELIVRAVADLHASGIPVQDA
ncbi:YdeI/OmpD-associated family protein [Tsukamurella paurometabola]|uniref:YdeI/OmpD-associated family protein n=1 Tax=Tsukamurella paurometabola TaxID=2061 RepID=A0ABS5NEP2_TSUPA|nr:YdeI/OmpD-associated family protein [Tsukamurella paurometabola]MBS4101933.1 YdeI/OmpD-associated family protein [Tsukamurella paurometabola]